MLNRQSSASAGARDDARAGESLAGIPWKLNPPVFGGDAVHFPSFEKETIVFAEYVRFGDVFKGTREIPVANPSIPYYAQLRSFGFFTDDEIDGSMKKPKRVAYSKCYPTRPVLHHVKTRPKVLGFLHSLP